MEGNGWDEHKRNVLHRLDTLEDDFCQQKGRCEGHLRSTQAQHEQLLSRIAELSVRLATLEGRLMGFLAAASVLGGIVSLAIQIAIKMSFGK